MIYEIFERSFGIYPYLLICLFIISIGIFNPLPAQNKQSKKSGKDAEKVLKKWKNLYKNKKLKREYESHRRMQDLEDNLTKNECMIITTYFDKVKICHGNKSKTFTAFKKSSASFHNCNKVGKIARNTKEDMGKEKNRIISMKTVGKIVYLYVIPTSVTKKIGCGKEDKDKTDEEISERGYVVEKLISMLSDLADFVLPGLGYVVDLIDVIYLINQKLTGKVTQKVAQKGVKEALDKWGEEGLEKAAEELAERTKVKKEVAENVLEKIGKVAIPFGGTIVTNIFELIKKLFSFGPHSQKRSTRKLLPFGQIGSHSTFSTDPNEVGKSDASTSGSGSSKFPDAPASGN